MKEQVVKSRVLHTVTPDNPPIGYMKIYPKANGKWYSLNSNGKETEIINSIALSGAIDGEEEARIAAMSELELRLKNYFYDSNTELELRLKNYFYDSNTLTGISQVFIDDFHHPNDLVYNNGIWIAIGDGIGDGIAISIDGTSWKKTWKSLPNHEVYRVVYNDVFDEWCVIGNETTQRQPFTLISSDNGNNWSITYINKNDFPESGGFGTGLVWTGARYVAIVNNFSYLTNTYVDSVDGKTWVTKYYDTPITQTKYRYVADIEYANGVLVGFVNDNKTPIVVVSNDDGNTWTQYSVDVRQVTNANFAMHVTNNKFFLCMKAQTSGARIWSSNDGVTWTVHDVATGETTYTYFYDVEYINGVYHIASWSSTNKNKIYTTEDFIAYDSYDLTYVNDNAHGLIVQGASGVIYMSQDLKERFAEINKYKRITGGERITTLEGLNNISPGLKKINYAIEIDLTQPLTKTVGKVPTGQYGIWTPQYAIVSQQIPDGTPVNAVIGVYTNGIQLTTFALGDTLGEIEELRNYLANDKAVQGEVSFKVETAATGVSICKMITTGTLTY